MSNHKTPLTAVERAGLLAHGLGRNIGVPSQLADVFRQGVAWGISQRQNESAATAPLLERIAELEQQAVERTVHNNMLAESQELRIIALERELETVRNEVLEEAAKACAAEKVNYELTQHAADEAYNMAVDHCAAAIRALKQ
jgi:protein required for attachment to host cells